MSGHRDGTTRGNCSSNGSGGPWETRLALVGGGLSVLAVVATAPALAQSAGQGFCETSMVQTARNIIRVFQLAGPIIGGTIAIGAVAFAPMVRSSERKKQLTEFRNRGVIWGVIIAPLGTKIIQFFTSNVVVGASACGF